MKNSIQFLILLAFFTRCADVYEVRSDFKTVGYVTQTGEMSIERTTEELEGLMQKVFDRLHPRLAKFGEISDVEVKKVIFEDDAGEYFIFARSTTADRSSTIAMPLLTTSGGTIEFNSAGETCIHECVASRNNPCSGSCSMQILATCKKMSCSCSGEKAACDTKITIVYDERQTSK